MSTWNQGPRGLTRFPSLINSLLPNPEGLSAFLLAFRLLYELPSLRKNEGDNRSRPLKENALQTHFSLLSRPLVVAPGILLLIAGAICAQQPRPTPLPSSKQQWIDPEAIPPGTLSCSASAPAGYPGKACKVDVDRDEPISPPTLLVPGGTTIYVVLHHPRWDEATAFNAAVSQTAPPNLLVDTLTSLGSPLSSLQARVSRLNFALKLNIEALTEAGPKTDLDKKWKDENARLIKNGQSISDNLTNVNTTVQLAGNRLACLENYRQFDPSSNSCNSTPTLTHFTVESAWKEAEKTVQDAVILSTPTADIARFNKDVTAFSGGFCDPLTDGSDSKARCSKASDALLATQTAISNAQKDIQTAQEALRQVLVQISLLNFSDTLLGFAIKEPFFRNATLTVVGTEVVTKTATTIATVTINWQQTGFVLSTGLLGSGMPNKTYAISSIVINGQVQTDPATGKNLSKVTATNFQPAMDFPAVFGSWVIPWISRAPWQYRCPGHCSFLLSAGAALNLTTKTAEFAVGPSFQIWGVLLTPSIVFGRQTVLADGITEGYTGFGINPPSAVPTISAWRKAFGIALTYTLPTP